LASVLGSPEIGFEDPDGGRAALRRAQLAEDDLRPVAAMISAELRRFRTRTLVCAWAR